MLERNVAPGLTRHGTCTALTAATLLLSTLTACDGGQGTTPEVSEGAPGALLEQVAAADVVDLTHPVSEETLVWPTSDPFEFEVVFEGVTEEGYYYSARNFSGPEHGGTHLDAPIHFAEGSWTTTDIPVDRFVGPGVVVDVSDAAAADVNHRVTSEELERWEADHGFIPEGAILLLFTDRSRLWPDAEAYMGTDRTGEEAVAELAFPGLHPEAARWLVEERDVALVGIDTPSIDHGPSIRFESHRILSKANVPALENVANLERLPPTGSVVVALPMKLEGGTGGPLRIVALVEG